MDRRILLLMLLGVSLLVFGCAGKKAQAPDSMEPAETDEPANETEPNESVMQNDSMQNDSSVKENVTAGDDSNKDLSDLADLFTIDTDKPLEGEGLDVETPESNKS